MVTIGILTISDRASRGLYEDPSGPAIEAWLQLAIFTPWRAQRRIVSDGLEQVADALIGLCDRDCVDLVLTTGGTGPSPRDLTPEVMARVLEKELPGFGEVMRRISFETVPTAIHSRQTAGTRGSSLIVNLPGKPRSIEVCLAAVFPAIPYAGGMGKGRGRRLTRVRFYISYSSITYSIRAGRRPRWEVPMSAVSEQSLPNSTWLRVVAVAAAIFGVATLYSAGTIVLDYGSSRELAGAYVPVVVWFNLAAGVFYVVTAVGIWRRSTWAVSLSVLIAMATALAAVPFALHVIAGGDYEVRTIGALVLRIGFWAAVAIILFRSKSRR